MTYAELKELLADKADICRATLPMLAEKPENEKTLDDQGLEFLMSGFMFLYDDYPNPTPEQMDQLRQTAATCAETYRMGMALPADERDDDSEAILNLSYGFLLLYSFKVSNDKSKMN